ncbi:MAG: response regulator [Treponemataceae bacterium]|nr:response regulator [Treponemataceae bacterium]
MKHVLIVDATPLFREYLKEKLKEENIEVEIIQGQNTAFTKLVSQLHDLIIINITDNFDDTIDFLDKKMSNPNTGQIPIIMAGPKLEKEQIQSLIPYKITKYFSKPIKFDLFFEAIGRALRTNFSLDTTDCILELHQNENVIFIEIAKGLNREKLSLLKYNIAELITNNKIQNPKVIIMMSDLSLSFVDGSNLEFMMENILNAQHISRKNIKILTMDEFTKQLFEGHKEYEGIVVADSISTVLPELLGEGIATDMLQLINERILSSSKNNYTATAEMRFQSELPGSDQDQDQSSNRIKIAVIDDDPVIQQILQATFARINADTDIFNSGIQFMNKISTHNYNLIVLDIFMPGISGFDIITNLHNRNYKAPIIVYSSATQREVVIQALSLGARSYLVKPQKPEALLQKVREILLAAN